MVYRLEKYDLKIMFTHLDQRNPDVVVTLGSEARTFQLEDFIDFWLEMTELVPKAVYAHLAYLEQLARQGRERSGGGARRCRFRGGCAAGGLAEGPPTARHRGCVVHSRGRFARPWQRRTAPRGPVS